VRNCPTGHPCGKGRPERGVTDESEAETNQAVGSDPRGPMQ